MTKQPWSRLVVMIPGLLALLGPSLAHAESYSTNFPLTENPISEGGRWINGGADGLDWSNVTTIAGRAVGSSSTVPYSDPTAILTGNWGPDQTVQATVYSQNPTSSYYQEVELRLRSSVAPHRITGYEVFFRCLKTGSAYSQIVRWNGPRGNFTTLASNFGAQYGVSGGDVVKATIVGNVIKGYINGVEVVSATDNTYATGNPGIGFNYGVGSTYVDFGFTTWSATDSPTTLPPPPPPPQNLRISATGSGEILWRSAQLRLDLERQPFRRPAVVDPAAL